MSVYHSFRVYRGLQKPLEFLMLKGRYVSIGAGILVVAFVLFIFGFIISGFLLATILTLGTLISGVCWIFIKQRKGLHSKAVKEGYYIIDAIIKMK